MTDGTSTASLEVILPCVVGLLLVTGGYRLTAIGVPAFCFTVGAVLGGTLGQWILLELEPELAQAYWWLPFVVGFAGGVVSWILLRKLLNVLVFLACAAAGALLKVQLVPDRFPLPVGALDVSPLVAGVLLAVALFLLRRPAIILLTSVLGTSLIVNALDQSPTHLWIGIAAGFAVQWLLPAMWKRRRRRRAEVPRA